MIDIHTIIQTSDREELGDISEQRRVRGERSDNRGSKVGHGMFSRLMTRRRRLLIHSKRSQRKITLPSMATGSITDEE